MLYKLRTIAKYERKILMRSWFFRIFAGLSLLFLFAFNMGAISEVGDMNWTYRAVPANIPYVDIMFLNVAQAIIAVFLASDFIKRDRKLDTTEVFYVRSMSNFTYIFGKTWSLVSIFLLVNFAVLTLALIFNLLASDTYVDWKAYLYYPILISLPTLIFIIGLSTLVMTLIRNQAMTFVLLLGYILTSLFYLQYKFDYLFDYMTFYLPLFHSDIVGFGDWQMISTLRGMYSLLGMGFIFLSVLLLKRLPQSVVANSVAAIAALTCIGGALVLGHQHLSRYWMRLELPDRIIALNNQYVDQAYIDIQKHAISFEQREKSFRATSTIEGTAASDADTFVFTLNPGLEVMEVTGGEQALPYDRQLHLLLVRFDTTVAAGTALKITIKYEGIIEQAACFPDIDRQLKYQKPRRLPIDIGQKYAFLDPNYVHFTQEAQWYPSAGVGYSDRDPTWYRKDFVDYQLTVKTLPGLKPVSIGNPREIAAQTFLFEPAFAVPQLALSIGNYKKDTLIIDGRTFSVQFIEGHDYFRDALPDIRDTLPSIINERMRDFERQVDLDYPFGSFTIVEVPGQFKTFDRAWTSLHETNQPGMVFIPERGIHSDAFDFSGRLKKLKRWRRRNRDQTEEDMQIEVLNRFLGQFTRFKNVRTSFRGRRSTVEETINPYYQFVQFYELCNNLSSDRWPVLNRIMESYLREIEPTGNNWARQRSGSTQYELANMVLQEKSFAEALTMQDEQSLIDNIIELKGETLFSVFEAKAKDPNFRDFINEILTVNRFRNLPFEEFSRQLRRKYGIELDESLEKWFYGTEMPRFLFNTPVAEKVVAGNREMTRVRFKVSNLGTIGGVIKPSVRAGETIEKILYLESGETKEVHYLFAVPPTEIIFNMLIAGNLPNQIRYDFREIKETKISGAKELERSLDTPISLADAGEIIADNEGPEFEFSEYRELSRLRRWLDVEEGNDFKYKGKIIWRPPFNWTPTTDDDFFGKYIRSAHYIKSGDGSKVATWKIPIAEKGRYDVYFHVYNYQSLRSSRSEKGTYRFSVVHQNGTSEPTLELDRDTPTGWALIGDYYFSTDTAVVTLNNQSRLRAVFADAVKLVKKR